MVEPVALRVLEICPGEFVVQYKGGLDSWSTFSDTFDNAEEARAWMQEQSDSADYDAE